MSKKYAGKLLLFGEYTVLLGGKALAIPLNNWFGQWEKGSPEILNDFLDFLCRKDWRPVKVDIDKIKKDKGSIYFKSNIPIGYGLGSSGAVSAAVFDRYFEKVPSISETQLILSEIESYFHGKSSGLDPLISYYNRSFTIEKDQISEVHLSLTEGHSIYLLDSGQSRNTKNLVQTFQQKLDQDAEFKKEIDELALLNNTVIDCWLKVGSISDEDVYQISEKQYSLLSDLIPKEILKIWRYGLDSGDFSCKICGAGGGGFFLLFSKNPNLQLQGLDLHHVSI